MTIFQSDQEILTKGTQNTWGTQGFIGVFFEAPIDATLKESVKLHFKDGFHQGEDTNNFGNFRIFLETLVTKPVPQRITFIGHSMAGRPVATKLGFNPYNTFQGLSQQLASNLNDRPLKKKFENYKKLLQKMGTILWLKSCTTTKVQANSIAHFFGIPVIYSNEKVKWWEDGKFTPPKKWEVAKPRIQISAEAVMKNQIEQVKKTMEELRKIIENQTPPSSQPIPPTRPAAPSTGLLPKNQGPSAQFELDRERLQGHQNLGVDAKLLAELSKGVSKEVVRWVAEVTKPFQKFVDPTKPPQSGKQQPPVSRLTPAGWPFPFQRPARGEFWLPGPGPGEPDGIPGPQLPQLSRAPSLDDLLGKKKPGKGSGAFLDDGNPDAFGPRETIPAYQPQEKTPPPTGEDTSGDDDAPAGGDPCEGYMRETDSTRATNEESYEQCRIRHGYDDSGESSGRSVWEAIAGFFRSVGDWLVSLFGKKKQGGDKKEGEKKEQERTWTIGADAFNADDGYSMGGKPMKTTTSQIIKLSNQPGLNEKLPERGRSIPPDLDDDSQTPLSEEQQQLVWQRFLTKQGEAKRPVGPEGPPHGEVELPFPSLLALLGPQIRPSDPDATDSSPLTPAQEEAMLRRIVGGGSLISNLDPDRLAGKGESPELSEAMVEKWLAPKIRGGGDPDALASRLAVQANADTASARPKRQTVASCASPRKGSHASPD